MDIRGMAAALCVLAAGATFAETTPVMVSLVTPVQAPSSEYDVTGFRLSLIYGDCRDFTGLDLGIAQRAAGDFTGIALGGVNIAGGCIRGGQVGLVNWGSSAEADWARRSTGAQIGVLNYAGSFCGLQDGFVNVSGDQFAGLQSGFVNCAADVRGMQCGYYLAFGVNVASGAVRGCQLGIVNYAETMECGLQIGIVNIIAKNGWLPVLPIVNGHF
ncbi:MAG: hypothetical protein K6G91_11480 [Kiritimatiellae bacterium]|nr:hypothetical protein [Kiritimatiellia bacterium]